ncbi:S8 family serine peptidase [Luteimonas sp. JM171]|uniref:S8 family serine peptidase n=1 Tax=Luteimonas sp. JM171 TaxID=1896164 RepID=UPI000AE63A72|nr:S8 family serine peptidase [Luteimonas sp. JM171]
MSRIPKWAVAALVLLAAAAAASGIAFLPQGRSLAGIVPSGAGAAQAATGVAGGAPPAVPGAPAGRHAPTPSDGLHIVVFREPALGAYRGEIRGMAEPRRIQGPRGKARLDRGSLDARRYVDYLRQRQSGLERAISSRIGRPLVVETRMQHAVNGIVAELTVAEADRVRTLPEVLFVEEYREYELDTDTGPGLIGAPAVWDGSNPGAPAGYQGEGMVFGILDSGINFGNPSFAGVDPVDGYTHSNPLGDGNYLGTCVPGGVDEGRCNAKLIGGYNFVCGPPANLCGQPNIREEPGFGDSNGHGTHVAGTVAGNRVDIEYRGLARRISGVAPRGNIVAFDICYTNVATGQGLCPNVSAVEAINQAIADGVVDVINYSIGGGSQPWSEAVSMAFLSAVDAGIYVAASAGNSGPGPNTMGHLEPWVSSTAAAQHGRNGISFLLQVTGPQPVPEPLAPVVLNEGSNGVPHSATIPGDTPLVVSPGFDGGSDGCAAYPPGALEGAIAVIRRGACPFSDKANNADAAGAVAVVIANNDVPGLIPSVPGTSIPVFGVNQADGDALRDFAWANPDATAMIGYPAVALPNTPDALAAFSSRGPAGSFDLVKPDVTAPGVQILAADAGETITGFENLFGLKNGTSMASPHQAGAAGLVRQARPEWTVPEVKSALAMTADPGVWLEDEVTPAHPFAKGSGRIRVDRAINAGLVMDETGDDYLAANPATGGDVSALNQPSLGSADCFTSCTFTRTFRSTLPREQAWRLQLEDIAGSISPRMVRVPAGGTVTVEVTINTRGKPGDGSWSFGSLVLEPLALGRDAGPMPTLRLPVAVSVPPPVIELSDQMQASVAAGRIGNTTGQIGNSGGSILEFSVDNTGAAGVIAANAPRGAVGSGYNSSILTDNAATPALFAADDFTLAGETTLTSIQVEGFVATSSRLSDMASALSWSIFPDAGGMPAGNPLTSPEAAAWSYSAPPTAAGITVTGSGQINNIAIDLGQAGQDVVLPAGRYWLVVHAVAPTAFRWLWFGSNDASGGLMTIAPGPSGTGSWTPVGTFGGLAMRIDGAVDCGAPWIGSVVPASGKLAPDESRSLRVRVSAAGLSPGTYRGNVCVASNDPVTPKAAAPVRLDVTP